MPFSEDEQRARQDALKAKSAAESAQRRIVRHQVDEMVTSMLPDIVLEVHEAYARGDATMRITRYMSGYTYRLGWVAARAGKAVVKYLTENEGVECTMHTNTDWDETPNFTVSVTF